MCLFVHVHMYVATYVRMYVCTYVRSYPAAIIRMCTLADNIRMYVALSDSKNFTVTIFAVHAATYPDSEYPNTP